MKLAIEIFVAPLRVSKFIDTNDFKSQFEILEKICELHSNIFNEDTTREIFNFIKFFEDVTSNKQVRIIN